jgi:hypothetical protein
MTKTVPEILREGADTYEERNKLYGDNYKRHGAVMRALFPNGVSLHSADAHNRFGLLTQIVAKLTRYCENFNNGGHPDSLHDQTVYAAMLAEVDAQVVEFMANNTAQPAPVEAKSDRVEMSGEGFHVLDLPSFLGTAHSFPEAPTSADEAVPISEQEIVEAIEAFGEAPNNDPPEVIPEPPVQK